MLNENDYPMSYKEFEKRIIELFLEDYSDDSLEEMRKRLKASCAISLNTHIIRIY